MKEDIEKDMRDKVSTSERARVFYNSDFFKLDLYPKMVAMQEESRDAGAWIPGRPADRAALENAFHSGRAMAIENLFVAIRLMITDGEESSRKLSEIEESKKKGGGI